jgi:hypothetical protein
MRNIFRNWMLGFGLALAGSAALFSPAALANIPTNPPYCHNHNPNFSIECTTGYTWCGNTCQVEPTCSGELSKVDCGGCACACPDTAPNNCISVNGYCQTTNATCATENRQSVCNTDTNLPAGRTQVCGACLGGYVDCAGTCKSTTNPLCPAPGIWDACNNKCIEVYVLAKPTVAQAPQSVDMKVAGNAHFQDGEVQIENGDLRFVTDNKAIRVSTAGEAKFNLMNDSATPGSYVKFNVLGSVAASYDVFADGISTILDDIAVPSEYIETRNLCFGNAEDIPPHCRNSWPIGLPETALAGQTVRYTGVDWIATSFLTNTGSAIGIGTDTPGWHLDVRSGSGEAMLNLDDEVGNLWTGTRLARVTGGDLNKEKWFVGMNGDSIGAQADDFLVIRNQGATPALMVDSLTGNVGINTTAATSALTVNGTGAAQPVLEVIQTYAASTQPAIVLKNSGTGYDILGTDSNWYITRDGSAFFKGSLTAEGDVTFGSDAWDNFVLYGKVGINVPTPEYPLDVRAIDGVDTAIVNIADKSTTPSLWTGVRVARDGGAGAEKWFVGMTDDVLGNTAYNDLIFQRDGGQRDMVIDYLTGYVGIGTVNPSETFSVGSGASNNFTVNGSTGNVTTAGDIAVNGGDITTLAPTARLFDENAVNVYVGGGAQNIYLGGGSAQTGCTIDASNGNLTCTGNITGGATGTQGFWSRAGTTLSPAAANDSVNIPGSGNLSVGGNTILGDASTDTVTVNANRVVLPNSLNMGSDALFIDSTNKRVGINENASAFPPGYPLDIRQNSSSETPIIRIKNAESTRRYTGLRLDRESATEKWFIGMNADAANADDLVFRHKNSTDAVTIDYDTGRVGIGSSTPAFSLDVAGTTRMNGFIMPTLATADYVLTSDASGVGTWQPIQLADECTGGKYFGLTAASYNGNIGSYQAADAICDAAFPDTHICTSDEILRSVFCLPAGSLPAFGAYAWIANGAPGFTSPAANDCRGFTSSSATVYGDIWSFNGNAGGTGYATSCSASYKIACCKNFWW